MPEALRSCLECDIIIAAPPHLRRVSSSKGTGRSLTDEDDLKATVLQVAEQSCRCTSFAATLTVDPRVPYSLEASLAHIHLFCRSHASITLLLCLPLTARTPPRYLLRASLRRTRGFSNSGVTSPPPHTQYHPRLDGGRWGSIDTKRSENRVRQPRRLPMNDTLCLVDGSLPTVPS
jgi:hypothetical protein